MSSESSILQDLQVGNMVTIRSRMWPGINKPGGAGRIIKLNYSNKNNNIITHIDVKYVVMGGTERNISLEYVIPAPDLEYKDNRSTSDGLRDRNCILGRCPKCGSLRRDCMDKCEIVKKHKSKKKELMIVEEDSSSSSSDDYKSVMNMVRKNRRKFKSWQKKHDLIRKKLNIGGEKVSDIDIPHPEHFSSDDKNDSSSRDSSSSNDDDLSNDNGDDNPFLFRRSEEFESDDDHSMPNHAKRLRKKSGQASVLESLDRNNSITSNSTRNINNIPNINETNDDLDHFLQPEGDADILPHDIKDGTANLSTTDELFSFFNTVATRLEQIDIPKAKEIHFKTLKSDPISYYIKFRHELIWNGTDQCRTCLQRLPNSNLEGYDLKMSQLDELVEEIMRPLNKLVQKLDSRRRPVVRSRRGDDDPIMFRRSEKFESSNSRKHYIKKQKSKVRRKKKVIPVDDSSESSSSLSKDDSSNRTSKKPKSATQSQETKSFIPSIHKNKDAIKNLNENNDYLDGFLQPEGNADTLPNDIKDRTANLSDDELLVFFDNLLDQLEHDDIPKAKNKSESSTCNPQQMYDKFRRDLIWNGTDQCRKCLSRLQRGKYRKKLDVKDLRLEQIDEMVEEIMRPLNKRISESRVQEEDDWTSDSETYDNRDLSNIFPMEQSEDFYMSRKKNDAHPYSTKRKKRDDALATIKDHKASKGKSRKQHSNRNSKGDGESMQKIDKFLKRRKRKRRNKKRVSNEQDDSLSSSSSTEDEESSALFPSNGEIPSSSKAKKSTRMKNGISYLRREKSNSTDTRVQGRKKYSTGYKSTSKKKEKKMNGVYYMKHKSEQEYASSSSYSEDENMPSFPTVKSLLKLLEKDSNTSSHMPSSEDTASFSLEDIHTIQEELQKKYTNDVYASSSSLLDLQNAIRYLRQNPNESMTKDIGSILKELLQNYGQMSLLQLMNDTECTADRFKLHIALLQTIALYITNTKNADCFLHPKPKELLDLMILQIIDAIYAHVLPSTWTHLKHMHWWKFLEPLCQILVTQIESVCRLICTRVTHPKQHVMKQNGNTDVFITIINPVSYCQFLKGEDWKVAKEDVRAVHFNQIDEVNALWSIISYFASFCTIKNSTPLPSSSYRWRLLILLLLKAQFSSFAELELGICYFSYLLESKVLHPIPSEDNFLIKLLERFLETSCSSTAEPTISTKKKERIYMILLESEDVPDVFLKKMTHFFNGSDRPLFSTKDKGNEQLMIHKLLLPDTSVLNTCVYLLNSWILSLPLNKKARRLRFDRAVEKSLSNLITQHFKIIPENQLSSQNFSEVFSTKPNKNDLSINTSRFFFQEMKGVLLWKITCDSILNMESSQKMWKLLSTESMRDVQHMLHQCIIQETESYSFQSSNKNKESSTSLASTCFKIIYQMLIFSLQKGTESSSTDEKLTFFLFSCLLSCLHSSCLPSHSSSSEICNSIHTVTTMNITFKYLMDVVSPMLLRRTFKIVSDIMERFIPLLVNFSPLVEGNFIADICFRSCLILLQVWSRRIYQSLDDESFNFICGSAVKDNDYFQDIDDDVFLNIDLDALVGTAKTCDKSENKDNISSKGNMDEVAAKKLPTPIIEEESIDQLLLSHKSLLSFLRNFLMESKPSTRYSIQDNINNGINNIGKELLERQADQISKLIVHLFIFRFLDNSAACAQQVLLFSTNISSSGDFFQDVLYFQNFNRCISERFCRVLVDYPKHTKVIFQRNGEILFQIMSCYLCSLVDSNILHEFPTSNWALLKKKGGEACVLEEEVLLARVQCGDKTMKREDFDIDAAGLFRTKKKRMDCKLNLYLCRYIWTFGKNLGKVIKDWSEEMFTTQSSEKHKRLLLDLSEIFSRGYNLNGENQTTENIPIESSLENECFKRITILNDFFTSVSLASLNGDMALDCNNTNTSFLYIICAVVRCIIEQIVYTHESVRYFDECAAGKARKERSSEEKYDRCKALALLEAFTELTVTCFSCLLRLAGTIPNDTTVQKTLHSHIKFLRDFIIVPVLNSFCNERIDLIATIHISETGGNEVRGIPALPFVLDPSVVRSTVSSTSIISNPSSSRVIESIWKKLRRRLLELVLHIAAGKPDSQSSTYSLYTAVLHRVGLERNAAKCGKENDFFAACLGHVLHSNIMLKDDIAALSSTKRSRLEKCADDYFRFQLHSKMVNSINVKELEMKHIYSLREFVLKKSLLPKLGFRGAPLTIQCRILKVLESLLAIRDHRDTSPVSSFATVLIVPPHNSICEFLRLSDVCSLAKSLIFCLRQIASDKNSKNEKNDCNAVFEMIFSLSCTMIAFNVVNDISASSPTEAGPKFTLYQWSKQNQEDHVVINDGCYNESSNSVAANYLMLSFSLIKCTAKILSTTKASKSDAALNIIEKCCHSDSSHRWNDEDDSLFEFSATIGIDFHAYYNLWRSWQEMTEKIYPTSNLRYSTSKRNEFKNPYAKQTSSNVRDDLSIKSKTDGDPSNDSLSKLITTANRILSLCTTLDESEKDSSNMEVS